MQRNLLFALLCLIALNCFAQKDHRLTKGLSPVENLAVEQMPLQDNVALMDAELARRGPGVAPRYATNLEVDITPATHGQWETTPSGSVWRLRIKSSRAYSLNFGFTQYHMPSGGQMVMYSPDYRFVKGPFTPADNEEHEQLWTPLVEGDELVIEVRVPTEAVEELELKLSYVNHAFQDFGALISGSCNLDVICGAADGWGIVDPHRDIIQSVAVISTGGGTFCTGFLVNNVEDDCTPFFMTANHCGINSGNAPSLVTYWNYQNSTCRQPNSSASGGAGDGQLNDFNTGAIFRASRSASDFVLVELDDPVSSTANAYFAGWDARGVAISNAIAVHHPRTDEKRISFENDATQFTTYGSSTPTSNYTHVRVIDWDVGTTEGGSSGSPLFDQDERVVGQLHGGGAACGNNLSDWYGSFAVSWDAGGNSSSRLRDWLDPNNTGTEVINGRWANDCSFTITATPVEQTICQPGTAFYDISASTGFSGSASLSLSGLPAGSFDFNPGNVSPGGTSTLSVESGSLNPGTYDFTVTGTNGGNSTDVDLTLVVLAGSSFPPDLLNPADNSNDIFPNPVLSWDGDDSGATTYEVQIATDENFTNIVETGTTTAISYQPTNASEGATRYYWRVRAMSDCGSSNFSDEFSFVTQNISCVTYTSDFATTISETGSPTIENDIFFEEDLTIVSVVIGMEVTHTYVGDLDARIFAAPGGTYDLFDRPGFPNEDFGCSEDNLELTFSDSSPNNATDLENTCNPSDTGPNNPGAPFAIQGSYRPINNFNSLLGESSLGSWTLEINDNASSDGGILEEWSVTVCYEVPSEPPVVVVNEMLEVFHNTQEVITNQYLAAEDQESGPSEIVYTITNLPNEGILRLNGIMLNLGDSFTQEDIDNGLVVYEHEGGTVLNDDFEFDLTNAAGITTMGNVFLIEIIISPLTANITQTGAILCNGASTGALSVSASGGVEPYQYALNDGGFQNDNIFTGLSAGMYTVLVQDMLGTQTSTSTITISQPTAVTGSTSVTDDQITVNASGGTPGYTYQLEDGTPQASNIFNNVANGEYTITITDTNGCSITVSATVAVNNIVLIASLVQEISCHDADDAIITALASGGMPDYQYRINNGPYQDESTFIDLGPGDYTVDVQDADGFTRSSTTITITNPELLTIFATVDSDEITAQADGGTPPLLYQLNNGTPQSSPVFTNVSNGDYTITVIDDHDCMASTSATVAVNTLMVSAVLVSDMTCNNANDGSLTANVSGGTPAYMYSLDGENFQASPTFAGLAAGIYTVIVLDSEGFTQMTNSVTITNPPLLTASASIDVDEITVTASGGTAPLLYQLNANAPQSSPVFTNVSNGDYTITVIDDNDCTATTNATVAVNTLMVSAVLVSNITCNDANDGSMTVIASGGTPAYQYSLDGENFQSDPTFTGLVAGTYTVVVLDSEGFMQTTNSVTVTNPPLLTASASVDIDDITVTANGGTAPLLYQLNGGPLQESPVFMDIVNGNYTITVIDDNNCTATASATVAVNTLVVSATLLNNISCNGANDGSLRANAGGGTPAYQYSLDGENFQSSPTFNGLAAGSYTVTVLDSEGFMLTTNAVIVTNPPVLTAELNVSGNSIIVSAEGGTPPLQYQLDDNPIQASPAFLDLPNGTYTVTVYDDNDCTVIASGTVAVNTLMVSAALLNDISCNGANDGTLMASVSGGTPAYTYSLDGENFQDSPVFAGLAAGTYAVTVMDSEGFTQQTSEIVITNPALLTATAAVDENDITVTANGGTGSLQYQLNDGTLQDSPVFTDVANGVYTITVYDANDCTISVNATVAVNTLIVSAVLVSDISCFNVNDGELMVEVQGGTAPFQYSLDGENFQDESLFTGLVPGIYMVTVLDSEGFTQLTNDIVITNPALLMMMVSVEESTITVTASGGTGTLVYSLDGENFQEENIFTEVPDGIYQIVVRDENGCAAATEVIVAVNGLLASVQVGSDVSCFGADDGSLVVTASGGIAPYLYSIDGGETFTEENTFGNLPAGTYQVIVEDAAGAMFTTNEVTIQQPDVLELTLGVMLDSIMANALGGTPPYEYSLDGGSLQSSPVFPDLPPGDYEIAVVDANGCTTSGITSIVVGIFNPTEASLHFQVYPNPNQGQFQLSLAQATGNKLRCQLYNSAGQLVVEQQLSKPGRELRHSFDLAFLPAGLYQFVLFDGNAFGTVRIIVTK